MDATCSDFDFGTALHIAASNLCTSAVKCLLELGANPAFRVCDFLRLTKQTVFFVSFSSFYCYCSSHAHSTGESCLRRNMVLKMCITFFNINNTYYYILLLIRPLNTCLKRYYVSFSKPVTI